ncbi:beta-galactosidase [Nonomuraea sp. NPDC048826]|uniref:beta-galactosidase n=1 Tax=Nonomuraea sp. NPDC048826 TaxID=3364347 RepID=UPI00371EA135
MVPDHGEFHYGRYLADEWREELLKVRAGGVTVVATYVFWNLHEERRGVFDWSGDRDLRRFVATCAELGLDVVMRIGPWGYGESRNGGFPDWVLEADCVPRADDPRYLALVRPLFEQIGAGPAAGDRSRVRPGLRAHRRGLRPGRRLPGHRPPGRLSRVTRRCCSVTLVPVPRTVILEEGR